MDIQLLSGNSGIYIGSHKRKQGKKMNNTQLYVFSGTANPDLATSIAEKLGVQLGRVDIQRFPDGEIFVKYQENIRGDDVYIVQPTCTPTNENLMELLIMLDAAKRASAGQVTAVIPYYGYARQDRKDQPRVPISAKLVADLLTAAGADRVLTFDLHAQQIQGFFNIPVDHLYARPVIVKHLRTFVDPANVTVVAPDTGSVKMAQSYADMIGCGFAVVAKRRISATEVDSAHLVGDVEGRVCVLVDDMTATAGTLIAAAKQLEDHGAKEIYAAVSHCCLNEKGRERLLASNIKALISTDSIPVDASGMGDRLTILSISELLATAIDRIHSRRSVSTLFRIEDDN